MTRKNRVTAARSLAKYSLIALATLAFIGWGIWHYLSASPANSSPIALTIPKGSSVLSVGEILKSQGLIRSPRAFQLYVRLHKLQIQAGDYTLTASTIPLLAQKLTEGRNTEIKLTIPEGLRREQIAELVESKLGIPQTEFLTLTKNLEGSLFPETYNFAYGATAQDVVDRLTSTFAAKTKDLNLTKQDIIIASIIEREGLSAAEKPVISGILNNRLQSGWPLEVDATIQYIMGKPGDWWPTPLLGDRSRRSPYNTYLSQGLPPAPICNPGLVSLKAAANPNSTPYYFYLHDKSGNIHYAATSAEHSANIAKYIN